MSNLGDLVINLVVGCHYFPPGPCLLSQPKRSVPLAGNKLYCLVTEAHRCKSLAQDHYTMVPNQNSNPRPVSHKSVALAIVLPRHLGFTMHDCFDVNCLSSIKISSLGCWHRNFDATKTAFCGIPWYAA